MIIRFLGHFGVRNEGKLGLNFEIWLDGGKVKCIQIFRLVIDEFMAEMKFCPIILLQTYQI